MKIAVFLKSHDSMINSTQTLPLDSHLFPVTEFTYINLEFILSSAGVFLICTTADENI